MKQREFIAFLSAIEKLKCNTRHSWTSSGRHESVAEHSWRTSVMAMLCREDFPNVDINKVIKMCLIHDIGEAVTGDIPSFYKTECNKADELAAVDKLLRTLPDEQYNEFSALFSEMRERKTDEAKLFKALDNMEAVLSHNEADISTWLPLEYTLNFNYGEQNVEWSDWLKKLKSELNKDSTEKIKSAT